MNINKFWLLSTTVMLWKVKVFIELNYMTIQSQLNGIECCNSLELSFKILKLVLLRTKEWNNKKVIKNKKGLGGRKNKEHRE
jgi:hypothetical protein